MTDVSVAARPRCVVSRWTNYRKQLSRLLSRSLSPPQVTRVEPFSSRSLFLSLSHTDPCDRGGGLFRVGPNPKWHSPPGPARPDLRVGKVKGTRSDPQPCTFACMGGPLFPTSDKSSLALSRSLTGLSLCSTARANLGEFQELSDNYSSRIST